MCKLLSEVAVQPAVPLPSCLQVLPHNRVMRPAQCMFSSENKSFQPCSIATHFAGKGELFCHHVVSARVPIVEHVSADQPPAATPAACTSARDERAGSGFTTSWPARSRHFRALLNSAGQHRVRAGGARRASRELYAGVIITARFERSSSSPASAPLVSPMPPFEPECSTCGA